MSHLENKSTGVYWAFWVTINIFHFLEITELNPEYFFQIQVTENSHYLAGDMHTQYTSRM